MGWDKKIYNLQFIFLIIIIKIIIIKFIFQWLIKEEKLIVFSNKNQHN